MGPLLRRLYIRLPMRTMREALSYFTVPRWVSIMGTSCCLDEGPGCANSREANLFPRLPRFKMKSFRTLTQVEVLSISPAHLPEGPVFPLKVRYAHSHVGRNYRRSRPDEYAP